MAESAYEVDDELSILADAFLVAVVTVDEHEQPARFQRDFRALVVAPGVARMASQAPDVDGVTYIVGNGERGTVGEFVDVKILRAKGFDFEAEIVGGGKRS